MCWRAVKKLLTHAPIAPKKSRFADEVAYAYGTETTWSVDIL